MTGVNLSRYDKLAENDFNEKEQLGSANVPFFLRKPYKRVEAYLERIASNGSHELKLLDLGCGSGVHSLKFAQLGYRVIGVDLSKKSIEFARNRCKKLGVSKEKLEFSHGDILSYLRQLDDNSIDIVTMHGVLYYLDKQTVIPEIKRVLKVNGAIICVETNGGNKLLNYYRRCKHRISLHRDKKTLNDLNTRADLLKVVASFDEGVLYYDNFLVLMSGFVLFRHKYFFNVFNLLDSLFLSVFKGACFKVTLICRVNKKKV